MTSYRQIPGGRSMTASFILSLIVATGLAAGPTRQSANAPQADSALLSAPLQMDLLEIADLLSGPLRTVPVHNVFEPQWDDSGVVIHHAVCELPQDWSGGLYLPYRYIMTYTPFRSPLDENPHVVVSLDGVNWTEELAVANSSLRDTIPNPIWTPDRLKALPAWAEVDIAHLSDPDMVLTPTGSIWLFFRIKITDPIVTAKYQIVATKSDNWGRNWTTPKIIVDTDRGDPVKGGMWSPAIWRDTADVYHMMGVYTNAYGAGSADSVNRIALWSCQNSAPDSGWVEDTVLYDFLPSDTATRDWWHPEILTRGPNELIMLMTTTQARQQGSGAQLFLGVSDDGGLTWDTLGHIFNGSEFSWTNIPFAYRAGAVHRLTPYGEAIDVWLAAKDTAVQFGESVRTGFLTLYFEEECVGPECVSCCVNAGNADGSIPTGDVSSTVNISDATYLLQFIFLAGPAPVCYEEGDVNGDGSVNIGDVTHLIGFIFSGGASPQCPAP